MYTSYIGKRFLALFNEQTNSNLSAKEFFEKELFPIFYDDESYLQSPANTPLFQLIAQKKTHIKEERLKKRDEISSKISSFENGEIDFPDMSFAIGYASADLHGTTSGQISSIDLPLKGEDVYASWIGAAFGIGLRGGYNILTDNDLVLKAIYDGWRIYRQYVNQTKNIANKIESWNSVWLAHRFSRNWDEQNPRANFHPFSSKKGELAIQRNSWVQIMFSLSKILPNTVLTVYGYSLGQMNKTIGFIQIKLPELKRFSEMYSSIFSHTKGTSKANLTEMYETEYGFNVACERFGLIGLRAIEPKDLKKYMPSKYEKGLPKLKDDELSLINYSIYITWIIAMINNEELLKLAGKFASELQQFIKDEKKVSRKRSNLVDILLSSKNRKDFISALTEIVSEDQKLVSTCNELVDQLMTKIAPDQLILFTTLLRFKYLSNNKL